MLITALLTHEFLKVWSKDCLNQNYLRSLAKSENYGLHYRLSNLLSGNGASESRYISKYIAILTYSKIWEPKFWVIKTNNRDKGFPGGSEVKNPPANAGDARDACGFHPWVGEIPWRRKWQPTPVCLPGEFHVQRSLVGCSPWGYKHN